MFTRLTLYVSILVVAFVVSALMIRSNLQETYSPLHDLVYATINSVGNANTSIMSNSNQQGDTSLGNSTAAPVNSNISSGPQPGTLQIPFTGLTRYLITPDISKIFGLNENTYAMLITKVMPGSPADKAGIKGGNTTRSIAGEIVMVGGDIILKVDGNESFVMNNEAFLNHLKDEKRVGENITLSILRNGQISNVTIPILAMPGFFWHDIPGEGVRIKYPSDWRVSQTGLSRGDIVKFFSPERVVSNGTITSTSVAGVFLKVFPSNNVSLDVLASQEKEDTESTRNLGISLIQLAGLPAYEAVFYDYSDPDRTLKIMSAFTNKSDRIYRIIFAADPAKYNDYLPLAREMMKSFRLT